MRAGVGLFTWRHAIAAVTLALALACAAPVLAANAGLLVRSDAGVCAVQIVAPDIVRLDLKPHGKGAPQTEVLDPRRAWPGDPDAVVDDRSEPASLRTSRMTVRVRRSPLRVSIADANGHVLLEGRPVPGGVRFTFAGDADFYGIHGFSLPGQNVDVHQDVRTGVLRTGGTVQANAQGDGGAPLLFSNRFGLLVDSNGGRFTVDRNTLTFDRDSRKEVEAFVIVGPPEDVMAGVGLLSGNPPMSPKWTLGFINSQWGTDEKLVTSYIDTYRARQIPIDGFIFDFDWKAWGEDNYGEWRWNSTHGAGSVAPDKFPDGASGAFARAMAAKGIKFGGIFKPRIVLRNTRGGMDAAAAYATAHHLFYPGEKPYHEYFSGRDALDLNFGKPQTRAWFWQHARPAYDAGIQAFWNDEADSAGDVVFDNFQFANMQRSFYEGVRATANRRVWSINRNFYLGAQRYAYGEWSGDISTGFDSMRDQATRMLSTLDLGEEKWSMDTGGFFGTPAPENYARWMEFAAFVPIDRVHSTIGQFRQPWRFGPQAEADAKRAIELRYRLLPYLYSYDREAYERNVGIVRPLFWEFPNDATDTIPYVLDEWMVGKWLLVAPILDEGTAHRSIYLPPGTWTDYFRGTRYTGGTPISYDVDPQTWSDIPLFVRAGAIIPTQPVEQYVSERAVTNVTVDIFPATSASTFTYYDDDGTTYDYERGAYFKQAWHAIDEGRSIRVDVDGPTGSYRPALQTYLVRVHDGDVSAVQSGTMVLRQFGDLSELERSSAEGWAAGTDTYGPVVYIKIDAGSPRSLALTKRTFGER
ncbi:MAG: TIM-barrel domain-containing protein [Vulcanimicrobiaceae bacterium]